MVVGRRWRRHILAALRRVIAAVASARKGQWNVGQFRPIRRLSTLTVGLVGFGRKAPRIAAPLQVVGTEIVARDPYLRDGVDAPPLLSLNGCWDRPTSSLSTSLSSTLPGAS